MMKWLRKHMKQIMVVVVLLAMFSFVGGQALRSIASPDRSGEAFARAFGKEIAYREHLASLKHTDVLQRLGLPWQYDPAGEMTVDHWYLLVAEAEHAGILVSDEEVEETLQGVQQAIELRGWPADYLDRLRSQQITIVSIRQALRRHLAIQRNFARVGDAAIPSESQIRRYVRDTEEKVRVRFLALDAKNFVKPDEPLAEEAVRAQFETYKDVDPAESETGYGYRFPRRVKVQYIHAAIQEIEPHMTVTFEEAKEYWKKNKGKYKKIEYVDAPATTTAEAAAPGPATTQPATQPAPERKKVRKQVQKTFSEARDDVERELRKKKAAQQAERAMRKATRELLRPWEGQKTDRETGYKPIPPIAKDPEHMRAICDRVSQEFGLPLDYGETPLSAKETLTGVPGFRSAKVQGEGGGGMNAADYAFRVPPFVENATGRDAALCLQLYQPPDAPLKGTGFEFVNRQIVQSTSFLLFRVVEAREVEAPAGLEEVRADVERDLRLMRGFERAEPVAKEVYAAAARVGLEPAVALFKDVRAEKGIGLTVSPPAFARRVSVAKSGNTARFMELLESGESTLIPPYVQGVGASEAFVDACLEMAQEGWQAPTMELPVTEQTLAATTQPAATPPPVLRLLSIPKLQKWFVVELLGTEKVDSEKFATALRSAAYNSLKFERQRALWLSWFKPGNIEARCRFERIEAKSSTEDDEDTGES